MKENKVSEKVKDAVVNAIHAGEDVVKVLGNITKEIISTAKDEELETKEKAQKLAKEALEGAKEGYKKAKPPTEEFVKKAAETIGENFKEHAPKVANFVKEIFSGIVEGTKEVIDESKKKAQSDKKE